MIIDLSDKETMEQAFREFNQLLGMVKANVDFGKNKIEDAFPVFCSITETLGQTVNTCKN